MSPSVEQLLNTPSIQATSEEIEAQRQWLETGTVPVEYIRSRLSQSLSSSSDPILEFMRSLVRDDDDVKGGG